MDVSFTLTDNATPYAASMLPRLSAVVRAATFQVEAHAKTAIQTGTKTGRVYKRKRRTHRASAKGEAPATDTGVLVNSIRGKMDTPGGLSGTVDVGAMYGAILEPDRPFMAPAAAAVNPGFVAAVSAVMEGK